jgi:hypothetical protein
MTPLLLALGVGLVLFGAIVLIRYSDRPGGTLKWLGLEVSSKGAGLPLIALGIAALALTTTRGSKPEADGAPSPSAGTSAGAPVAIPPAENAAAATAPACVATLMGSVAAERRTTVEVGMRDLDVVSPPQPLDLPFALALTENGSPVGAIRLRLYRGSDAGSHLFKVEAAVDAACRQAALSNASRGGDPRSLPNWDTLRLRLGQHDYSLRIGAEEQIRVGSFSRAS